MDTKSLIIEITTNLFQQKGYDDGFNRGWNDALFNQKISEPLKFISQGLPNLLKEFE